LPGLNFHQLQEHSFPRHTLKRVDTFRKGDALKITVGSNVTLGDSTMTAANVVLTDLPSSNGVIHVIDKVLLLPGL